ncbi:MAG TPA: tetratricopeptide repeat protein [Flavipsychrobacter sp.]|nr:tetratricopeptide repeat protein [Flavipsychrobacter sp.]
MFKRLLLFVVFFSSGFPMFAQDAGYWPSPEVEQMYRQAKEYLSRGAVNQATVLLQQAIQLAPSVLVLHRDLAQTLNLAGKYDEAYKTIEPIIDNGQGDEMSYQIAATALSGKGEKRKTKNMLEKGLKAFPNSGILYRELGLYYEKQNDQEYALDSWLKGIQMDPIYHLNYYDAARIYATTNKPIWTILYGEIFCNLERQTSRSLEMRKTILQAYQKMFSTIGTKDVPKYGTSVTEGEEETFEAAVLQTYMQLAPVVSDGITADNLTMLRARFVMDWQSTFSEKFPFSLFTYQDKLLRDGQFDAYNQWMFGVAENAKLYETWKKFHPSTMPAFESWIVSNQYKPTASDNYNNNDLRKLFSKKRKS